jgi:hypothetical protein
MFEIFHKVSKKFKNKTRLKIPRVKESVHLLAISLAVVIIITGGYLSKHNIADINFFVKQTPIPNSIKASPSLPPTPSPTPTPTPTPTPVVDNPTVLDGNWVSSYSCTNLGNKISCTVKASEINVFAAVNTSLSWVKPDRKTAYNLEHEQTHFNINEIFARKARDQTRQFIGQSETAESDNEQAAVDYAVTILENRIQNQIMQAQNEANAMQDRYDSETGHGINTGSQSQWNQTIKDTLGI